MACHGLVVALLIGLTPKAEAPREDTPIQVELVTLAKPEPPPPPPPPEPEPKPKAKSPPKVAKAPKPAPPKPPPRTLARAAKTTPTIDAILAKAGPPSSGESDVSAAEIAGAATAGSGGAGGRSCNMASWLEGKLRKDRTVQAAFAESDPGKAVRVWNGRWVRQGGQDGNGLAAVREAIMWHVAFAPEACRAEPVHGLVLISLDDGPRSTRIVMGSGAWRWSDLLHARSGG